MKRHSYFIYILTTNKNTTIYVGVTNNLLRRMEEHEKGLSGCFTRQYNVKKLVYYEHFSSITQAIKREKQLKNWKRSWKNELITSSNKDWKDLFPSLIKSTKVPHRGSSVNPQKHPSEKTPKA